eukprot:TRINITY_DN36090_c0_g1_i1.p1 TRINITY_DN36090_c0_g1~~TRINITY_DN36090_c0_g1_i1.p1  ORF type:complete len:435 (+),score=57.33 TRINITY_DN36090_c0_g1_i1:73-1377(+)
MAAAATPSSPPSGATSASLVPTFPDGPFAAVPNLITCCVIASGCALMVAVSIPDFRPAYCMLAVVTGLTCDILDGAAARMLKASSKFGAAFDQLADLTCFGIGPAVFFVRMQLEARTGQLGLREMLCLLVGFAYMACSVARIARELVVHSIGRPSYFVGIPTNLACPFVVGSAYLSPGGYWPIGLVLILSSLLVSQRHIDKDLGFGRITGVKILGHDSKMFSRPPTETVFPDGPFASVPNLITCCVVACGCALMVGSSIPASRELPEFCIAAVLLGLLADVLDGMAARALNVTSKFGAAFDQLADLTCFGIGPAVFFIRMQLDGKPGFSFREMVCLFCGFVYMACSAARIARELVVHSISRPRYFVGIPTNLACPFVVFSVYMHPQALWLPPLVFSLSILLVCNAHIDKDLGLYRFFGIQTIGNRDLHSSAKDS